MRLHKEVGKRRSAAVDKALASRPTERFPNIAALSRELTGRADGGWLPKAILLSAAASAILGAVAYFGPGDDPAPEPLTGPAMSAELASDVAEQRGLAEAARDVWLGLERDDLPLAAFVASDMPSPTGPYEVGLAEESDDAASALAAFQEAERGWKMRTDAFLKLQAGLEDAQRVRGEAVAAQADWQALAGGAPPTAEQLAREPRTAEQALEAGDQFAAEFVAADARDAYEQARDLWQGRASELRIAQRGSDIARASRVAFAAAQWDKLEQRLDAMRAEQERLLVSVEDAPQDLAAWPLERRLDLQRAELFRSSMDPGLRAEFEQDEELRTAKDAIAAAQAALAATPQPDDLAALVDQASAGARVVGLKLQALASFEGTWLELARALETYERGSPLRTLDWEALGGSVAQATAPVEAQLAAGRATLAEGELNAGIAELRAFADSAARTDAIAPALEAASAARSTWRSHVQGLSVWGVEAAPDPGAISLAELWTALEAGEPSRAERAADQAREAWDAFGARYAQGLDDLDRWSTAQRTWEQLPEASLEREDRERQRAAEQARERALEDLGAAELAALDAALGELRGAATDLEALHAAIGVRGPRLLGSTPAAGEFELAELPELTLEFDEAPGQVTVEGIDLAIDGNRARGAVPLQSLPPEGRLRWSAVDADGNASNGVLDLVLRRAAFGSWAEVLSQAPDPTIVTDPALRATIEATGLPWKVLDAETGIELVLLPPGEYYRGQSPGDSQAQPNERPTHGVVMPSALYVSTTEVTRAQWSSLSGDPAPDAASARLPHASVSITRVREVLAAGPYRLPRESEWEYACRAGSNTPRHGRLSAIAWAAENAGATSHPVGGKQPNGFGLFDMLGNVSELCATAFDEDAYARARAAQPYSAERDDELSGERWVLRGGAYTSSSERVRASARIGVPATFTSKTTGLRVVRDAQ